MINRDKHHHRDGDIVLPTAAYLYQKPEDPANHSSISANKSGIGFPSFSNLGRPTCLVSASALTTPESSVEKRLNAQPISFLWVFVKHQQGINKWLVNLSSTCSNLKAHSCVCVLDLVQTFANKSNLTSLGTLLTLMLLEVGRVRLRTGGIQVHSLRENAALA